MMGTTRTFRISYGRLCGWANAKGEQSHPRGIAGQILNVKDKHKMPEENLDLFASEPRIRVYSPLDYTLKYKSKT